MSLRNAFTTIPLLRATSGLQLRRKVLRKNESGAGPVGERAVVNAVGVEFPPESVASPESKRIILGCMARLEKTNLTLFIEHVSNVTV